MFYYCLRFVDADACNTVGITVVLFLCTPLTSDSLLRISDKVSNALAYFRLDHGNVVLAGLTARLHSVVNATT